MDLAAGEQQQQEEEEEEEQEKEKEQEEEEEEEEQGSRQKQQWQPGKPEKRCAWKSRCWRVRSEWARRRRAERHMRGLWRTGDRAPVGPRKQSRLPLPRGW